MKNENLKSILERIEYALYKLEKHQQKEMPNFDISMAMKALNKAHEEIKNIEEKP